MVDLKAVEATASADAKKAESYIAAHWHSWGGGIVIGFLLHVLVSHLL